jgi:hypothetical protein
MTTKETQPEHQRQAAKEAEAEAQRAADARARGVDEMTRQVRDAYAGADQPGLHPGNRPSSTPEGGRDPHKPAKLDLEDITGNPGHRNVTPGGGWSMNPAPSDADGPPSINEPPGSEVIPPPPEPEPKPEPKKEPAKPVRHEEEHKRSHR